MLSLIMALGHFCGRLGFFTVRKYMNYCYYDHYHHYYLVDCYIKVYISYSTPKI